MPHPQTSLEPQQENAGSQDVFEMRLDALHQQAGEGVTNDRAQVPASSANNGADPLESVQTPALGYCLECGEETECFDEENADWCCKFCRCKIVAGQERDHFLDDPRHGQAAEINRGR